MKVIAAIWRRKWAALDQITFNAANFVLNLLLVSMVGFAQYGIFAILVSISAAMQALLAAYILEPVTVFGAGKSGNRYIYAGAIYTSGLTILGLTILAVLLLFMPADRDSNVLFAAAVAVHAIGYSSFGLSRRIFYLRGQSRHAFHLSLVYGLVVLATALSLIQLRQFSVVTVLCLMGGVSALLGFSNWAGFKSLARSRFQRSARVMKTTSKYRKWSLAAVFPSVVSTQSIYWLGSIFATLEAIGLVRLIMQFGAPIVQLMTSLNQFELVRLGRKYHLSSRSEFVSDCVRLRRMYLGAGGVFLLVALPVCTAFLVYSGEYGVDILFLVGAVFAAVLLQVGNVGRNIIAKASRNPEAVFWSHASAAFAVLAVSPLSSLIAEWGLATALLAGAFVYAVTIQLIIRNRLRDSSVEDASTSQMDRR